MAGIDDAFTRDLTAAADQFIVARGPSKSVIAGYPWFADWGRDTMIALPGLTLATNRYDAARSILEEFARYADRGMLPNRFPDAGETPEYNTVDATLGSSKRSGNTSHIRTTMTFCAESYTPSSPASSTFTLPARVMESRSTRMDCWNAVSRVSNSPGWTPRSAIGW